MALLTCKKFPVSKLNLNNLFRFCNNFFRVIITPCDGDPEVKVSTYTKYSKHTLDIISNYRLYERIFHFKRLLRTIKPHGECQSFFQ